MSSIADQLGEKIEAVQYERTRAAAERRKTITRSRNEKARRMVSRLEDCDEVSRIAFCSEGVK